MDGLLVGQVAPFGYLDGVDLADEVRDGYVRRRQLLAVAELPADPLHLQVVALLRQTPPARRADDLEGVAVDLTTLDPGNLLVQQLRQATDNARLRLAALPKEDHVVTRQDRVLDLRNDGLFITHDTRQKSLPRREKIHEIVAHLVAHRAHGHAATFQFAEGIDGIHSVNLLPIRVRFRKGERPGRPRDIAPGACS